MVEFFRAPVSSFRSSDIWGKIWCVQNALKIFHQKFRYRASYPTKFVDNTLALLRVSAYVGEPHKDVLRFSHSYTRLPFKLSYLQFFCAFYPGKILRIHIIVCDIWKHNSAVRVVCFYASSAGCRFQHLKKGYVVRNLACSCPYTVSLHMHTVKGMSTKTHFSVHASYVEYIFSLAFGCNSHFTNFAPYKCVCTVAAISNCLHLFCILFGNCFEMKSSVHPFISNYGILRQGNFLLMTSIIYIFWAIDYYLRYQNQEQGWYLLFSTIYFWKSSLRRIYKQITSFLSLFRSVTTCIIITVGFSKYSECTNDIKFDITLKAAISVTFHHTADQALFSYIIQKDILEIGKYFNSLKFIFQVVSLPQKPGWWDSALSKVYRIYLIQCKAFLGQSEIIPFVLDRGAQLGFAL